MVEVDVRKQKMGILVLMHDATLDRTTNAEGKVNAMTLKKLKTCYLKDKTAS